MNSKSKVGPINLQFNLFNVKYNIMPAGRPKKKICPKQVFELSKMQCTLKEMAAVVDCHVDTLSDNYSREISRGRECGKFNLRRSQMKLARTNATLSIWLGKIYLGQRDPCFDEKERKDFITEVVNYVGAASTPPSPTTPENPTSS